MKSILVVRATATEIKENYGKPFISKRLHEKIVKVVQYFNYFYDTKKGLVWIEGKPHKIIVANGKILLQYGQETLRSLNRDINLMKAMQGTKMENLKNIFA